MDGALLALLGGILIVGIMLIVVMAISKRGPAQLDVDKYRSRWLVIEQQLQRDNMSSHHLAVLNADKLLDQALRERAVKGETMGERMRAAKDTWSNPNAIWSAHKLRNRIAHEADVHLSYDDARRALSGFKQALKDLGAI